MRHIVRSSRVLAAFVALAVCPVPATHAGTYTVNATCGAWDAVNYASHGMTVYAACPQLTVRNVQGHTTTPGGAHAAWIFQAPAGSSIQTAVVSGTMIGKDGWQATVYLQGGSANGLPLENCPSASCPGATRAFEWQTYGAANADAIIARVRCGASGGCYNGTISGGISVWTSLMTIADASPPAVSAEGALAAAGWKAGTLPVAVVASDNVGIKQTRAFVDGVPKAAAGRPCDYAKKVPCPNGADALNVPLGGLPDGQHTLTVQAVDSADNVGGADRTISVDNTPPVAPEAPAIAGGPGWRAENQWAVTWKNPVQKFAPIVAAEYQLCPAAADSDDAAIALKARKKCVSGSRSGLGLERIDDLTLRGPGDWTMRLWLVDAAGNRNPDTAVKLQGLGFDPTPPTSLSFADQRPDDPARLRVHATDDVSGLASGAIEVRRRRKDVWRPLPTEVTASGLTAFMDDELLAKGSYDLRAVAVNRAGLQQGTAVRSDGRPATLRLPIRLRARLQAGRLIRRCTPSPTRCTTKVVRRLTGRLGRRTTVHGRLRSGGRPIVRQDIEVWRRLATTTARWTRIGTARTGRSGRYTYRVPRGPAAHIRFRYAGTAHVRGVNAVVSVRVPARTSIRPSRRNAVNGEYVTFQGRVAGREWIPPEGALVELQVYTRRRWRTFAQPRASAETGRWEFQYRFETIRGDVSFRFRARIRRQSNYPFHTGRSRPIRIRVHGL